MRSLLAIGLLSLTTVTLFACGDDSGNGANTAGTGGEAGAGGSAGSSNAGTGGGAGSAGTSGGVALCSGCVQLTIPFTAAAQSALYQFSYSAPGYDLSNAVVTWKIQTTTPNAGIFVQPRAQNGSRVAPNGATVYPGYYNADMTPLTAANFPAGEWHDVVLDFTKIAGVGVPDAGADTGDAAVATDAGDAGDAGVAAADAAAAPPAATVPFDKSEVESIQLSVGATTADTGTITVLIDSVTITGVLQTTGATFIVSTDGLSLNNYSGSPTPPGTPAPIAR
jgi:hypothetical protein